MKGDILHWIAPEKNATIMPICQESIFRQVGAFMNKKVTWWVILAVSAFGLCLIGCLGIALIIRFTPNIYEYALENSSLEVGGPAPDFELTALTGETVRLSQFRGQPVLLSFGASWCPDCRLEAPLLEEVYKSHPELVVLLVDLKEDSDTVQRFADEFGMTHPILLDRDGEVAEQYQVFAIPTELFIDGEGIVRAKIIEKVTPQLLAEYLPMIGINSRR
jgi:peroxiredoxin